MDGDAILRETERYFHEMIPMTRAMGVQVAALDDEGLVLTAPLEANHNHLGTAFGGSLSAIATLAGYGMLWLELGERDAHVVVRQSEIDYFHPVRGEIRSICRRPSAIEMEDFKARFGRSGKARIDLRVTVEEEGRVCAAFEGTFVALK
ncbi:YiiD C-terminal domain-containing protein [Luteolibacter marinus]|uniref:YiiD C-terminal domain-containing protein n=1 Tax=Luteolibacter marinus TaxID=2776705 RepID=UPI00186843E3|nr:YiiD C-terminal domain-containing protein [Luteolibacter marinus]